MLDRILGLAACALVVVGWTGRSMHAPAPRSAKYVARMTGAQETPSNNGKSTGTATFTIDGTKLQYTVLMHDLSGSPTSAHIHVGATRVAGPPVYPFAIKRNSGTDGTISEGTIDLTTDASAGVSGDSLKVLLNNGSAYVNVHPKTFPTEKFAGR